MNSLDILKEFLNSLHTKFSFDSYLIFKISLAIILGFGIAYLFKIWNSYRFFKRLGIKNVENKFFYGNFPEMLEKKVKEK